MNAPGFAAREKAASVAWLEFAGPAREMSHEFRAGYHRGILDESIRALGVTDEKVRAAAAAMPCVWSPREPNHPDECESGVPDRGCLGQARKALEAAGAVR